MDILLLLFAASMLVFAAMVILDKKRQLGFFSIILSTCALCELVNESSDLQDGWILLLLPLMFVLLMSIVAMVRVGTE